MNLRFGYNHIDAFTSVSKSAFLAVFSVHGYRFVLSPIAASYRQLLHSNHAERQVLTEFCSFADNFSGQLPDRIAVFPLSKLSVFPAYLVLLNPKRETEHLLIVIVPAEDADPTQLISRLRAIRDQLDGKKLRVEFSRGSRNGA